MSISSYKNKSATGVFIWSPLSPGLLGIVHINVICDFKHVYVLLTHDITVESENQNEHN